MSAGLEAITNELRRLQRDGVSRVFVQDDTMRLIVPKQQKPTASEPSRGICPKADQLGDLRELIKEAPNSERKTNSNTTAKSTAGSTAAKAVAYPPAPQLELPDGDATTQLKWLHKRVLACEVCQEQLREHTKIVFGTGSPQADILFCGEAPGAEEAHTGEPFVGEAGQLLNKIITAMGLTRESVYLTNIVKWRPEHNKPYGNRPPTTEEMRFCLPYLKAQIEIVQPKVIVALGSTAVTGLLGSDPERKMGKVRGTWATFEEIPLMITFHPSYLLRNGTLKTKRLAWEDMLQIMEKCALGISEKQRGFFLPKI